MISKVFEDKRLTAAFMIAWLIVALVIFATSGIEKNEFLHIGPSNHTIVMGFKVDTWEKWRIISLFAFVSTCLNDFIFVSINQWVVNTIQDDKAHVLPYPKWVCLTIVQAKSFYGHVMAIFGLALLLAQFDFFLIRTSADLIVGTFATIKYMENKSVDTAYTPLY
eukprot:3215172-Rhodomonas_salina.1